jgi:hypothetical protein
LDEGKPDESGKDQEGYAEEEEELQMYETMVFTYHAPWEQPWSIASTT